jgi:hypothetical protein
VLRGRSCLQRPRTPHPAGRRATRSGRGGSRHQRATAKLHGFARRVVGALDGEVREPVRRCPPFLVGLPADAAVEAAGVSDRRIATFVRLVFPAEQVGEERFRTLDIGGHELVPAQSADIVHDRRADHRPRLPQRENRPGWIADRGHAAGVEDVERGAEHGGAAELTRTRRGRVGVLYRDVGGPVRRRARRPRLRLLSVEDRDVVAGPAQHPVRTSRAHREFLRLPAEQARVEPLSRRGVRCRQTYPAEHAWLVVRALAHLSPPDGDANHPVMYTGQTAMWGGRRREIRHHRGECDVQTGALCLVSGIPSHEALGGLGAGVPAAER